MMKELDNRATNLNVTGKVRRLGRDKDRGTLHTRHPLCMVHAHFL